jgi:tRNA(fMet)-specific endonuclease VapC
LIYLLDTNICIYALKRHPPEVLEKLRSISRSAVAVSVITVLELRQGAEKSQDPRRAHQKLDFFLSSIRALPFDEEAALVAARIRASLELQGRPIGDLDSLIAAHALAQDLILVTNNLREFQRVPDLRTETWVS